MVRLQEDWWNRVRVSGVKWVSQSAHAKKIRDDILDELRNRHHPTHTLGSEQWGPAIHSVGIDLGCNILALFSMSVGTMECQIRDIVRYELASKEYVRHDAIIDLFENRSFYQNLELADDSGVIEKHLYDKATDVRKTRNTLEHNPTKRHTIENVPAMMDKVKKAVDAPDELHKVRKQLLGELLTDSDAFDQELLSDLNAFDKDDDIDYIKQDQ